MSKKKMEILLKYLAIMIRHLIYIKGKLIILLILLNSIMPKVRMIKVILSYFRINLLWLLMIL